MQRIAYAPSPHHLTSQITPFSGAALAQCLQTSECVMIQRHTAAECLAEPLLSTLPTPCQQLKRGFRECKRGMVDMRKRFRGNQPVGALAELEGGSSYVPVGGQKVAGVRSSGQMYAGRPAFEVVKARSGDEPENQMDPEK